MSDFLARDLSRFVRSGNNPDYPVALWVENPLIGGQPFRDAGVPLRHVRAIAAAPSTLVEEMDVGEKTAVDAAAAAAQLVADRSEVVNRADIDFTTRSTVAEAEQEIQKLRVRIQEIEDALTDMKGTATLAALRNAIPNGNTSSAAAPATFSNISDRLVSQWMQDIVDRINAGGGDP